jgi:hypothetical protein
MRLVTLASGLGWVGDVVERLADTVMVVSMKMVMF